MQPQVYTTSIVAESFTWDEVSAVQDRLLQIKDLNLSDAGDAANRAAAALREAQLAAAGGKITVPMNAGQELWDVVSVTDTRWAASAQLRRVVRLSVEAKLAAGVYRQGLSLGGR